MDTARLTDDLRVMFENGVFFDPLVVNSHRKSYDVTMVKLTQEYTQSFLNRYGDVDSFGAGLDDFAYSDEILGICFEEILLATATSIVLEEGSSSLATIDSLIKASSRVDRYVEQVGVDRVYKIYTVVTGHDIMQPLFYRREVPEVEFLSGIHHHPYEASLLFLFLMGGLARGIFRYKSSGSQRLVYLTRKGFQAYKWTHELLKNSGYIAKRISLSYVYQFDTVEHWDELCNLVWPDAVRQRSDFVGWANVAFESRVLEVACGTGALTFEGELYQAIGDAGQLTAIDNSSNMLEKAKQKHVLNGRPPQVKFELANVEQLPYADETFDMVIGSAFLHFVNPVKAIAEMRRCVTPSGFVCLFQALDFNFDKPFFRDWFHPIFELARRRNAERPHSFLPVREELERWMKEAGLYDVQGELMTGRWLFDEPETTVQHIVRGTIFFQTELMELPWGDRKSIITELIDRGHDVRVRYSLADRTIHYEGYAVKGRRTPLK